MKHAIEPPRRGSLSASSWIVLELLLRRGAVSVLAPSFVSGFAVDWTILLVGVPGMPIVLSVLALRMG